MGGIRDPGVKKAPDPGSGSATLIKRLFERTGAGCLEVRRPPTWPWSWSGRPRPAPGSPQLRAAVAADAVPVIERLKIK
jgi:hypothetical protein